MSIFTITSGADAHPEIILLQLLALCLEAGGVKNLRADDHFLVSENSGGADMQVEIQPGAAVVVKGDKSYPIYSDSTELRTVSNNASGQARIDAVVLHWDTAASPAADTTGKAKITIVPGTPAGSPVAPDATAIESAIGSSDPYTVLAHVAVANGASSITDANITDVRKALRLKGEPETNWTYLIGDGAHPDTSSGSGDAAITFDRPYLSPPIVTVTVVGYKNGSNPTDIDDTDGYTAAYIAYAGDVSTTGFKIGVTHKDSSNIDNGRRVLVTWSAVGRLA